MTKVKIEKTWRGYEVSYYKGKIKLYIRTVRNGKINAVTDYTHAGHFTEATAKKYAEGIKNGTIK